MARNGEKFDWSKRTQLFSVTTDKNGRATITRLPPNRTEDLAVEHEQLELPANGLFRFVEVDLKSDRKNEIRLKLQAKGTDTIGSKVDD